MNTDSVRAGHWLPPSIYDIPMTSHETFSEL